MLLDYNCDMRFLILALLPLFLSSQEIPDIEDIIKSSEIAKKFKVKNQIT